MTVRTGGVGKGRRRWINSARMMCLLATCPIAICATTHVASAQPSAAEIDRAQKLFNQAEVDETAQNWGVALDELRRAASIKMTAGIRFHIALCESNLQKLAAALADFAAADLLARIDHNQEVVDAVRDPRADLDARVPRLKLTLPSDVTKADVRVDGNAVTDFTEDLRVDPGRHTIEARADGRAPFLKKITTQERDAITVAIDLPSLAPPPKKATSEAMPSSGSKPNRFPAILATTGVVVLVGAGVGSFLVAGEAQSDARDACTSGNADCNGEKSKVHVWDAVALGAWIGAAGMASLAVVLWVTPTSQKSENAGLRSVRLHVTPRAIELQGKF